jgi:hypothetical protein
LIESLNQINDSSILGKFEKLLLTQKNTNLSPMSLDEFYSRIERSKKAIQKGKVISQEDLEKESENW